VKQSRLLRFGADRVPQQPKLADPATAQAALKFEEQFRSSFLGCDPQHDSVSRSNRRADFSQILEAARTRGVIAIRAKIRAAGLCSARRHFGTCRQIGMRDRTASVDRQQSRWQASRMSASPIGTAVARVLSANGA
jgi:hypothetical protein